MPTTATFEALEDLLRATGRDHHDAFASTDGFDPEWPLWYSQHLVEPLGAILDAELTRSDLIHLLVELSREHPRVAPGSPWSAFYARALLDRYGIDD